MGEIVRLPVKNSWKEFNNQTHCGLKYYHQSFYQSLGEILTEFQLNQQNPNECASPEPRQNKMKALLHRFCKPQMLCLFNSSTLRVISPPHNMSGGGEKDAGVTTTSGYFPAAFVPR